MVSVKTVLKWLLVTAAVWAIGFVMLYAGYGNTTVSMRELLLVTGLIIVYGATLAIAVELMIAVAAYISAKNKKRRLAIN